MTERRAGGPTGEPWSAGQDQSANIHRKAPNVFAILDEPGPFSVNDKPNSLLAWRRGLSFADGEQYKSFKHEVLQMLGVSSLTQARSFLEDPELREYARRNAIQYVADSYGFTGNSEGVKNATRQLAIAETDVAKTQAQEALDSAEALHGVMLQETMQRLSNLANGTIRYVETEIIGTEYKEYFSVASEVEDAANPADLIDLMLNPKNDVRVRFEAKRKLLLMKMGAAVWQTMREVKTNVKYDEFKTLWGHLMDIDPEEGAQEQIGKPLRLAILTHHDPETFKCLPNTEESPNNIKELPAATATRLRFATLPEGQKLTVLDARTFTYKGLEIPVFWDSRRKQDSAIIIKSMRSQRTNPRIALQDELGLLGVLRSKADIKTFIDYMLERSAITGIPLTIEDIEDTIENDQDFSAENKGSSPKLEVIKCFVRINGIRVEFMFHTFRTYADYSYADEISHDEYSRSRFFDSGVAKLFYPEDIYEVPLDDLEEALIDETRNHIRKPHKGFSR